MDEEVTPGGSEIFRHEASKRDLEPTEGDPELIGAVSDHLERFFGPVGAVFHEIVSDRVHVDVHFVSPGADREWITLVTSGMAERPMTVPDGLEDYRYAELVLALPADWPLAEDALAHETYYWPLRLLKDLARLPHDYGTFLCWGHTIPNGDPPEPYADGTSFCGALVADARLTPEEFDQLALPDGRSVYFYGVYALLADEMEFKLEHGAAALLDRFVEEHVTEWVDLSRRSVVAR